MEQPVFGANYIKGKVRAQDNGQFVGEAKFKLLFKAGGAIEFAQVMLRAAHMAKSNANNSAPPPYTPPTGSWHEAPPPGKFHIDLLLALNETYNRILSIFYQLIRQIQMGITVGHQAHKHFQMDLLPIQYLCTITLRPTRESFRQHKVSLVKH